MRARGFFVYNSFMSKIRHIVFDLDGTLIDSKEAFEGSLLEAFGREDERIPLCFGLSQRQILDLLEIEEEKRESFVRAWRDASLHQPCEVFAGLTELLEGLHERGYVLSVLSSRSLKTLRWTLEALGLLPYFDGIYGEELEDDPKPSPEPMLAYLALHGLSPDEAIYIGDLHIDRDAAQSAGMHFAYAGWNPLAKEGGAVRFESTADCLDYFDGLRAELDEDGMAQKIQSFLPILAEKVDTLNHLNYFPVPDDDTGSNMYETLEKGLRLWQSKGGLGRCMVEASKGNSGIIMAAAIKGFLVGYAKKYSLKEGLDEAVRQAYGAVLHPKEGTMLTFLRYLAENYQREMNCESGLLAECMITALEMTRTELSIGRIDSGALGLAYLVAGLCGLTLEVQVEDNSPKPVIHLTYGYCTELRARLHEGADLSGLVEELSAMGDSINYIVHEGVLKLHVHTNFPGKVMRMVGALGERLHTKIDNMRLEAKGEQPWVPVVTLRVDEGEEVFTEPLAEYAVAESAGALEEKLARLKEPVLVLSENPPEGGVRCYGYVSRWQALLMAAEEKELGKAKSKASEWAELVREDPNGTLCVVPQSQEGAGLRADVEKIQTAEVADEEHL